MRCVDREASVTKKETSSRERAPADREALSEASHLAEELLHADLPRIDPVLVSLHVVQPRDNVSPQDIHGDAGHGEEELSREFAQVDRVLNGREAIGRVVKVRVVLVVRVRVV